MHQSDTIVAPATGPGDSAVAIVRLSGPRAIEVFSRLFERAAPHRREAPASHRLVLGVIRDPGGRELDQALGVVMRAPHSYTGEDCAEFHCHGGRAVVSAIVDSCVAGGARLAEPGEFSRRAFLNGRIDLAQAEAVADLIAARTELGRRAALRQLRGGLSARVGELRDRLLDAAALIEAHLDFPEEDIPDLGTEGIRRALDEVRAGIVTMLRAFGRARHVREGARVVLTGPPNAGKSSLFNALIGRERAIVSPHPGTTRDTIEATVDLGGVPVTFVDTAGLRDSRDEIERIGIERAHEELAQADLVLLVLDPDCGDAAERIAAGRDNTIVLMNKSDLGRGSPSDGTAGPARSLSLSAVTREGLDRLETLLAEQLRGSSGEDELLVTTARHAQCLEGAVVSLGIAAESMDRSEPWELVMVDLRNAIMQLGDILGIGLDDEILDRIFSRFCLGK